MLNRFTPAIGLGLILTLFASFMDVRQLAFAVLAGVWFGTTLGVGGLLGTIGQRRGARRDTVVPRRTLEWLGASFPYAFLAAVVVGIAAPTIYPSWWKVDATDAPRWFGSTAFWLRTLLYFLILGVVGMLHADKSAKEDETGDPKISEKLRKRAISDFALVVVATGGLATEWLLALHAETFVWWMVPAVTLFLCAGALTGALAVALLAVTLYERAGLLAGVYDVSDRQRLAKLLPASIVATAILGAALALLTKTLAPAMFAAWSPHWLGGSWCWVSVAWIAAHVVALGLLVGPTYRSTGGVVAIVALVLAGRVIEAFQLVMPVYLPGRAPFGVLTEVAGLSVGLAAPWVSYFLKIQDRPVFPPRDPLLTGGKSA